MSFIPAEIIRKKRDGLALKQEELAHFVSGYLQGQVSDGQMGAFLMAVTLKGMTVQEAGWLTQLARDSGQKFHWPDFQELVADKHSTGGVGDKTSMVILPLCLLEGLKVPMMAGRGLGHTGGTIDKLESIPNMRVRLSDKEIHSQMNDLGGVLMGQTDKIVPLDYRLYHLRDVTATVESIPLIVASILSKKLAEGVTNLVMDIKFGSGAFMKELSQARELSRWLIDVGLHCGLTVRCVLSSMDSPLGKKAGNALEIEECIEVLQNKGPRDTLDLSIKLAAQMIQMVFSERKIKEIETTLHGHIESGRAWEKFCQVVKGQGGDLAAFGRRIPAKIQYAFTAQSDGYITEINVRHLGLAIVALGGGRIRTEDKVDPAVGLSGMKQIGEPIKKGEAICTIHASSQKQLDHALAMMEQAYKIGPQGRSHKLIEEMIT